MQIILADGYSCIWCRTAHEGRVILALYLHGARMVVAGAVEDIVGCQCVVAFVQGFEVIVGQLVHRAHIAAQPPVVA